MSRQGRRWRLAHALNHLFYRRLCWADLVRWAAYNLRRSRGLRGRVPWWPITDTCRDAALDSGRCYCGKLGPDGAVLRRRGPVECQGADFSAVAQHLATGLEQHADRDGLAGPARAAFLARGGHAPNTACPSEPSDPVHGVWCDLMYDGSECTCGVSRG